MLVSWILSRLKPDESGLSDMNFIYESFKFEMIESGKATPVPSQIVFTEYVKALIPDVKRERKKVGTTFKSLYRGISIKPVCSTPRNSLTLTDIIKFTPPNYYVKKISKTEVTCESESGFLCNGHSVNKTVIFHSNGTWDLVIAGKTVDLPKLYIDHTFDFNEQGLNLVFATADKMQLCNGMKINKSVIVSRYHTVELWQKPGETTARSVRSVMCSMVIPVNTQAYTCRICQKMTFSHSEGKENTAQTDKKPEPLNKQIKKLFPQANDSMIELLLEQAKNVGRHPKGRRWSEKFLGVCLQMYNRSPHCYSVLLESNLLVLPSKSLLILYKNSIKQEPGFDENIFHWMFLEANRQNIPVGERYGGLIFDEMSIQTDLQLDKKGNIVEISGFTDYGKEGDSFHSLRQGTKEKSLGKYILQLLFLGTTGFRFPFAHFITNGVQASELSGIFWKAVYMLYSAGFTVLYTCMDGAQANRSFMHMCLGEQSYNYIARNPGTNPDIIFLMDYSHVIKKVRNNILKSGTMSKCTRLLTLPNNHTIQWQMFVDFFNWDRQNALQTHRKLTTEHFYMDSQLKMRNHLAEDVLNSEMLHAFKLYRTHLGEKGQVLDGTIEFLENTSLLVDIFRDMRPIKSKDDNRLKTLKSVDTWFCHWEAAVLNDSEISQKEKWKKLLSRQCIEDLHSCIQGFIALCNSLLQKSSEMYITPALVNSDIIENVFSQQRATYHGANSNPNALQYRRAINSVVVGQNIVSNKSNAAKVHIKSEPYRLAIKQPLRKRPKVTTSTSCERDFKVIRI